MLQLRIFPGFALNLEKSPGSFDRCLLRRSLIRRGEHYEEELIFQVTHAAEQDFVLLQGVLLSGGPASVSGFRSRVLFPPRAFSRGSVCPTVTSTCFMSLKLRKIHSARRTVSGTVPNFLAPLAGLFPGLPGDTFKVQADSTFRQEGW